MKTTHKCKGIDWIMHFEAAWESSASGEKSRSVKIKKLIYWFPPFELWIILLSISDLIGWGEDAAEQMKHIVIWKSQRENQVLWGINKLK